MKEQTPAIEKCVLCGSPDRDLRSDHLRECYKISQDKLDRSQFHPHLTYDEMNALQRGSNPICSNRRKCAERQLPNFAWPKHLGNPKN